MSLSIVLVRPDAEKLKFFSFAASLNKRVADDVEKQTLTIYGSRQLGGKKNATSVNLPLERTGACLKYLTWVFFKHKLFEAVDKFVPSKV